MTKREFLDTVFALAPHEANAIMDAFDEYVESNEPHWIPVTERLPEEYCECLVTYRTVDMQEFMDILEYEPSYEFDYEKGRFKGEWLLRLTMKDLQAVKLSHGCHCPNLIRG